MSKKTASFGSMTGRWPLKFAMFDMGLLLGFRVVMFGPVGGIPPGFRAVPETGAGCSGQAGKAAILSGDAAVLGCTRDTVRTIVLVAVRASASCL
jgi:hypothetical protein